MKIPFIYRHSLSDMSGHVTTLYADSTSAQMIRYVRHVPVPGWDKRCSTFRDAPGIAGMIGKLTIYAANKSEYVAIRDSLAGIHSLILLEMTDDQE